MGRRVRGIVGRRKSGKQKDFSSFCCCLSGAKFSLIFSGLLPILILCGKLNFRIVPCPPNPLALSYFHHFPHKNSRVKALKGWEVGVATARGLKIVSRQKKSCSWKWKWGAVQNCLHVCECIWYATFPAYFAYFSITKKKKNRESIFFSKLFYLYFFCAAEELGMNMHRLQMK